MPHLLLLLLYSLFTSPARILSALSRGPRHFMTISRGCSPNVLIPDQRGTWVLCEGSENWLRIPGLRLFCPSQLPPALSPPHCNKVN